MTTQIEMFAPAKATDPNVRWLEDLLQLNRDWMTAQEIVVASALRLSDRDVRRLAAASEHVISWPGSPGYAHMDHVTMDQASHGADALESQSREMLSRAMRLRKRLHEMLG